MNKFENTHRKRPETSSDQTRTALIRTALKLFGRDGFDGTSTRAIAAEANANIGSIAYHFGGKEGLRSACAEHIVSSMETMSTQVLAAAPNPAALTTEAARGLLRYVIETMATFMLGKPDSAEFVPFVLRELSQPTAALDVIYNGMFAPMHGKLCEVWAAATGDDPLSPATRLSVFTLIGQVVYFRIAHEAVVRRMDWESLGPAEAAAVTNIVTRNLDAIFAARDAVRRKED